MAQGNTRYFNPRGKSITCKTGFSPVKNDPVAFTLGTAEVALPVDFSRDIIGIVSVTKDGMVQPEGAATVEVVHQNEISATVGEAVEVGDLLMYKGSDKKFYQFLPKIADATQTVTYAGSAGSNGVATITVAGVAHAVTITNGDTATVAAASTVTVLNAAATFRKRGLYATSSAGVVTITGYNGALSNSVTVVAATTASVQTVTAGAATLAGGIGYPESSAVARSASNTALNGTARILLNIKG